MTASERLRSCWSPSRLTHHAISGHHSEASLGNYMGRLSSEKIWACSDILSNALSGRPHQSLQPSFAALSSRAIFMFRWIRLSFIQKTLALNSLFSTLSCEKTRVFFMSHNSAEVHWTFQEVGRNTRLRLVFLPTLLSCSSRFLRAL